jgi:hypothetical protein
MSDCTSMIGIDHARSKRKACCQCAKAKTKCTFSAGQKVCDRCRRLRRDCIFGEASRPQKAKQSTYVCSLTIFYAPMVSIMRRTCPAPDLTSFQHIRRALFDRVTEESKHWKKRLTDFSHYSITSKKLSQIQGAV